MVNVLYDCTGVFYLVWFMMPRGGDGALFCSFFFEGSSLESFLVMMKVWASSFVILFKHFLDWLDIGLPFLLWIVQIDPYFFIFSQKFIKKSSQFQIFIIFDSLILNPNSKIWNLQIGSGWPKLMSHIMNLNNFFVCQD
jgi:hypothetical protein